MESPHPAQDVANPYAVRSPTLSLSDKIQPPRPFLRRAVSQLTGPPNNMAACSPPPSLTDAEVDELICWVCGDVYRSPRILPCSDTFCLDCLKDVSTENGGQSFPCPFCKEITAVPAGGCDGFKVNKYIKPKTLEAARAGPRPTMCSEPDHQAYRLEYYCVQCDRAICVKCKLTTHENHSRTLGLYEAAARCRDRLGASKDRLERAVNLLTRKSAAAHEHLSAYTKKAVEIKEEIKAEADALVARVLKKRDNLLSHCESINAETEKQLYKITCEIRRELDALLQVRQRVHHALTGSASHAEVVDADKEMREGRGSEARLERAVSSFSTHSHRPGLRPGVKDCDIERCMSTIRVLGVPFDSSPEVVVPIFRCSQDGARGEVHSVSHVADDRVYISFGGALPDYAGEKSICINNQGQVIDSEPVSANRKFTCMKFYFPQHVENGFELFSKETQYFLFAKGGALMATTRKEPEMQTVSKVVVKSVSPLRYKSTPLFHVHCIKTVAFDATQDGQLFAFVEEKINKDREIAEHTLLLFRYGQTRPFIACKPGNDLESHPTDVCFWREDEQGEKLLVADMYSDAVHVLSVKNNQCHFERRLASGNALLFHPTALDVDWQNRVWIGCGNGRILMYEKAGTAGSDDMSRAEGSEVGHLIVGNPSDTANTAGTRHGVVNDVSCTAGDDDLSCAAGSHRGLLVVGNPSVCTNTASQMSAWSDSAESKKSSTVDGEDLSSTETRKSFSVSFYCDL